MKNEWKRIWNSKKTEKDILELEDILKLNGYDTRFAGDFAKIFIKRIKDVTKYFHFKPEDIILDAGCGAGAFLWFLKHQKIKFKNYIGIDYSLSLLEAFKHNPYYSNSLTLLNSELAYIPLQNYSVDKIFCYSVFLYFENIQYAIKVLNEFDRILKYNGEIIISDIPDINKKVAHETFRKSLIGEEKYNELYKNLHHLYYDRRFFLNFFKSKYHIEIFDLHDINYPNSLFRFSVYLKRK
ncbi:class I SAM-dependent methyltransferase [Sulfurihydrogenibium subterraneum]|uniref:class I SAM-dependent methyltransferase n=1 Tax=Sulfurihydrogenibium subterraneum TaxID=171121 RepID=UPI00048E9AE7|nr:class I SAM-dependent methyltransferase [Sulfurihydrogenibium subterraneum]